MLLAIDTATQTISVALHDTHAVLYEQTWHSANQHTTELAPAIQGVLARAPAPLTAVAVCIGPGTYTGLRVGVALAKALAGARSLPLVGVSSLDILAAAQPQLSGALLAVVGGGRSRVTAGVYQWRKGKWRPRGDAQNMDWDTLLRSIDGAATLTGEIDAVGRAAIAAAQADGVPLAVMPGAFRLRRAGFLAEEALARLRETDDEPAHAFPAAAVVPVYTRTKDAP
jgi:tRNA threonylcarbamoyladenosine biosynthesis protein TsaB